MTPRALRRAALQGTLLALDCIWLASLAVVLRRSTGEGTLPWGALWLLGAPLLLWVRWLWGLVWWETRLGRAAAAAGLFVTLTLLVSLAAPTAVGGVAGVSDWIRGVMQLPFVLVTRDPVAVALLVGALLVYRILTLVVYAPTFGLIRTRVLRAGGLFLLATVMAQALGIQASGAPILAYAALALFALALARAEALSALPHVASVPFTGRWLRNVGMAVGSALLVGTLVALVLPVGELERLAPLLRPLLNGLLWGVALLLGALAFLFAPLVEQLVGDVAFPATPTPVPPNTDAITAPVEAAPPPLFSIEIGAWLPYVLLALMGVVALLVVLRWTRQRRQRRADAWEPETLYTQGAADAPGGWLRRQVGALRDRFARTSHHAYGIDTVRDLYLNLQQFGAARGLARPLGDTPYEYLHPLCEHYPHRCPDFRALTDAYVAAHYGDQPVPRAEVERLQQAWQRIAGESPPVSPDPPRESR